MAARIATIDVFYLPSYIGLPLHWNSPKSIIIPILIKAFKLVSLFSRSCTNQAYIVKHNKTSNYIDGLQYDFLSFPKK